MMRPKLKIFYRFLKTVSAGCRMSNHQRRPAARYERRPFLSRRQRERHSVSPCCHTTAPSEQAQRFPRKKDGFLRWAGRQVAIIVVGLDKAALDNVLLSQCEIEERRPKPRTQERPPWLFSKSDRNKVVFDLEPTLVFQFADPLRRETFLLRRGCLFNQRRKARNAQNLNRCFRARFVSGER
jgi:hypothetical protein